MSLRYWNTVGERANLNSLLSVADHLMEEQEEFGGWTNFYGSSEDDDSTISSLSSLSSSDSLESLSSSENENMDTSLDTIDMVLEDVAFEHNRLMAGVEDEAIDFDLPLLRIADISESDCILEFRFRKTHLQLVANLLWSRLEPFLEGDREQVRCQNRYTCPYETGLLLVLFRLARPRRLRPDMERYFCMRKSHISAVMGTFIDAFYDMALPYFSDPSLFYDRFPLYTEKIAQKARVGGIRIWGFIDGTLRKTCRPSRFQRLAYSGHKRCHGIKFQSVVTPDGLIALLFGPIPGNRHDSFMLSESKVLHQLRALMPDGSPFWSLYGDPAYPQSSLLFGGFRGAPKGSPQALWNRKMSSVRECVEWLFKEIISDWSFLDFRASMKIFQFPVAKYYMVAAFLTNLRCCLYGSQTSHYFGFKTHSDGRMKLDEYIGLVPPQTNAN